MFGRRLICTLAVDQGVFNPALLELKPSVRDLKISVRLVVDAFYVRAVRAQIVPDPLGLRAARFDFNDGDRGHANDKRGDLLTAPLMQTS